MVDSKLKSNILLNFNCNSIMARLSIYPNTLLLKLKFYHILLILILASHTVMQHLY